MHKKIVKSGELCTKIIECAPNEFIEKIKNLEKRGLVVADIKAEATRYLYTISHYEERKDVADEQWRDIPGVFYGHYQLSSLGRVRSVRILKEYAWMILTDGRKRRYNINVKKLVQTIFNTK